MYNEELQVLIAGDTVFSGSIGRTDLPGGNQTVLFESIQSKILSLSDETRILSGHGPDTTVGKERASNPWLQELVK
jgi:glyoxylase-like metal-dependent hydrolase (beta-lactamase superfamily II)